MLGRRRVHGLRQLESEGLQVHGEHGDGDDRDVHDRRDHHLIRHGYHALYGLLFHGSVVIGVFLEMAVLGRHEPKVVVLADDSEVSTRVISGDLIDCEAIGPICNRDELHRR